MAEAAGHKWGQFVGEYCESAIEPQLQAFADKHGLFLDKKGPRPARSGKKLRWVDTFGNGHDLDYVLERGGTLKRSEPPSPSLRVRGGGTQSTQRTKPRRFRGPSCPSPRSIVSVPRSSGASLRVTTHPTHWPNFGPRASKSFTSLTIPSSKRSPRSGLMPATMKLRPTKTTKPRC